LSYNNLVDINAAWELVNEFESTAVVIIKHTNPCGVAVGKTLVKAFRTAYQADPLSAFGGIVALNKEVDGLTASAIAESFFEVIIASSFSPEALEILRRKRSIRLISCGSNLASKKRLVYKDVFNTLLVQEQDGNITDEVSNSIVVTNRSPSKEEIIGLEFSWKVAKHVKSNAIVLAKCDTTNQDLVFTVGIGAGQMSRVESVNIACRKAGDAARGSVLASDAFFPFPDGLELAASYGVTAVVQPGGSIRDHEVIYAANKLQISMLFTSKRHFRH
jgi:phosphoribosylaminoimidazolecarboxamide formyltransferase/IMP cyclohydrolase